MQVSVVLLVQSAVVVVVVVVVLSSTQSLGAVELQITQQAALGNLSKMNLLDQRLRWLMFVNTTNSRIREARIHDASTTMS